MDSFLKNIIYLSVILVSYKSYSAPYFSTLEVINPSNSPYNLQEIEVSTDPAILPSEGYSSKKVWFGNYFPASKNGTGSAMIKYDQATNNRSQAYIWETEQNKRINNVNWSGHCNGLAAASINEPEPKHAVTYNGVFFSIEDIKALLVEAYQNSRGVSYMTGLRCEAEPLTTDRYGRPTQNECRDLNAASFHILVTNYLGRYHKPLIMDVQIDSGVWNYAIVSYKFTYEVLDANAAAQEVGSDSYIFNKAAQFFMKVNMKLLSASNMTYTYSYILEGNEQELISGGEWIGRNKIKHPDFIWRQTQMNLENPFLDLNVISKIAELAQ
jgi:hypothetical protein